MVRDKEKQELYAHVNFKLKKSTRFALVRCPDCHKENYAINVLSGVCTWCGFNINEGKNERNNN